MKKNVYYISSAILLAVFAIPVITNAQMASPNPGTLPPPTVRDRIQSEYQTGLQNIQNNRDYRNAVLENHASSTPFRGDMREPGDRPFTSSTTSSTTMMDRPHPAITMPLPVPAMMKRLGSSSPIFASSTLAARLTENHQHEQQARADAFAYMQNNLVKESSQALDNLANIRARIASRIDAETMQGIDMSKATALLETASDDAAATTQSVQALAAYVPTASGQLASSTPVDLSQARTLGSAAIAAVNKARQDLDKVIQMIIQTVPNR